MAKHSITDELTRYEAVGGTWEQLRTLAGDHVTGTQQAPEAWGVKGQDAVIRIVEAAERAARVTFKKSQQNGEWFAKGRADILVPGEVTITKRSGETVRRTVTELTRTFVEDGVEMVYGRLAPTVTTDPARRTIVPAEAYVSYRQGGAHVHEDASGRTITYDYS